MFPIFNFRRRATLLSMAACALAAAHAPAWSGAMVYRYWDWGKTPRRDDYQVAVLELALRKTEPAYGPYWVVRVLDNLSTFRARREVNSGKRMNVLAGPWRDQRGIGPLDRNFLIDIPMLHGLLGCRRLIVRREDLPRFSQITSSAQLKQLKAGMARGWVDVDVLRHNGYKVEDSGNLNNLFDMLANQRFHYLPMSVIEVESALAQHPGLAVVPELMLYYPLPTVFYVSDHEPRLAERLEAGLAMAKRDGTLDELLARHFQKELQEVKSGPGRYFVLDNPLLPQSYAAATPAFQSR
ncbi:substrate-binding periplasmic protein [Pseudoduganella namucuonensis]|uniref:Extracellular solute-binding protein, family 3 n=1 Tax=Pseudoduganella namucuonensis TaxID=1035707 RepID=A0A1I7M3M9_9BURK|nr:transporter substrate-binding domain-containing protein [Pseudoduganella namucuonensis]SFV16561.1 extracellular solute-binding protein, family 3 [Pseudoduganella namucuonensis]